MRIAGIPRSPEHSPNMSDKDMLLLREISEKLREKGHTVEIPDNSNALEGYDAIFHMSRSAETLSRLAECEKRGIPVTNATAGVRNCSRKNFMEILRRNGIRQPAYSTVTPSTDTTTLKYPGWMKKSEGWSSHIDDVQFVASPEEADKALQRLAARGCDTAIYSEHVKGDLIKFYGVCGTDFFRHHYPDPETTKFGLERINGKAARHPFDHNLLKRMTFRAAQALQTEVFGGDCIVTPEGEIYIIDMNDFPSFSAYRQEAAEAIAHAIENPTSGNERIRP